MLLNISLSLALLMVGHLPSTLSPGPEQAETLPSLWQIVSASDTASAGENKGTVDANSGFTVTEVTKNNTALTPGVDYEIVIGTDGTSKVKIGFTSPLATGDVIKVTGTIDHSNAQVTLNVDTVYH